LADFFTASHPHGRGSVGGCKRQPATLGRLKLTHYRHLRGQIRLVVFLALLFTPVSFTDADPGDVRKLLSDASDIGLAAGAAVPEFRLKDQHGQERDRSSLTAPNGLVLVFFRSADW
jgi:hypothetical protein